MHENMQTQMTNGLTVSKGCAPFKKTKSDKETDYQVPHRQSGTFLKPAATLHICNKGIRCNKYGTNTSWCGMEKLEKMPKSTERDLLQTKKVKKSQG